MGFRDARRFQRLTLNTAIEFRRYRDYQRQIYYEDKKIEAMALDISEGGMGLLTKTFIPQRTFLEIWISLSGLNQEGQVVYYGPMRVLGKVIWIVPWDNQSFRLGITFLEMQDEDRKTIASFIKANIGFKEKIIRQKDVSSGTVFSD